MSNDKYFTPIRCLRHVCILCWLECVNTRNIPHLFNPFFCVVKNECVLLRPSQGCVCGGGVPVPLFPRKRWPCSLVPQKQNLDFLCSLFPKIACAPLFPLFLGLCSPVPLKQLPLFPCSPKPLGGLHCCQ